MSKSLHWFIVVGRMLGDDEATASSVRASDRDDAVAAFREEIAPDDTTEFFLDAVFDCGVSKPKQV